MNDHSKLVASEVKTEKLDDRAGGDREATRQDSIERILQRKHRVFLLPRNQKLTKLSMYSACQGPDCRCTGWKTPEENRHKDVEVDYCPDFQEECRNPNCKHPLEMHISHLGEVNDDQTNELLGAIVDVENLYMSMLRETDTDTKKVYAYLFRVGGLQISLEVQDFSDSNLIPTRNFQQTTPPHLMLPAFLGIAF